MKHHVRISALSFATMLLLVPVAAVSDSVAARTEFGTCKRVGTKKSHKDRNLLCTQVGKKRVWRVEQAPKAPETTTTSTTTTSTTTSTKLWTSAMTAEGGLDNCRLPDRRDPSLLDAPRSLGFPLNQSKSKAIGVVNLVLVASDFSDFVGTASELTKIEGEIQNFNTWLRFQSNGRLTANWQFPKKWLRLPRTAGGYGVVGFNPRSHDAIVADVVAAADPDVNYAGIDEMFVYLPDSLTTSEPNRNPFDGILAQFGGSNVLTAEGVILIIKGSGTVSQMPQYGFKPTLWALWAHDLLHTIGIEGHNPVESFTLESEDYTNHVMSAWNQFLAGWMRDEQVACIRPSDISARSYVDVDLVPLQLDSQGFRTAIIPITETRAIIVESHRNVGYAKNFDASGILVYLMDTKNVLPYSQRENTASVGSRFLDSTTVSQGQRRRVGNGRNSAIMLPNEMTSFENVIVEFTSTGQADRIRLKMSG